MRFLFDAYGTLFDLSAALAPAKMQLGEKAGRVLSDWRIRQLDYAWLSALSGRYRDFETLTQQAFRDALAAEGIDDSGLVAQLSAGFRTVQAYEDAAAALAGLKVQGARTAILSNGTAAMLNAAVAQARIGSHLDGVLSVDAVGTYKPAPQAYQFGADFMQAPRGEISFVSSNWWDVMGAGAFGFRTVWVDRGTALWPASMPAPDKIVAALSALVPSGS